MKSVAKFPKKITNDHFYATDNNNSCKPWRAPTHRDVSVRCASGNLWDILYTHTEGVIRIVGASLPRIQIIGSIMIVFGLCHMLSGIYFSWYIDLFFWVSLDRHPPYVTEPLDQVVTCLRSPAWSLWYLFNLMSLLLREPPRLCFGDDAYNTID